MSVKVFKLIIISILLAILTLLPGELYQGYLDQYNDFYETSFYIQDNSPSQMLQDLSESAKDYNIQIFKIYERSKTTYSTCLDIYAEDEMVEILSSEYGISEGKYQSLFSGNTEINVYSFSDISEELLISDATYYLYGDYEDMVSFKETLVDIYAGSFPHNDGFNDISSYQSMILFSWILAIAIVVILALYDLVNQKKEIFILASMGTRKGIIYLKNVLVDDASIIVGYGILKCVVQKFEGRLSFDIYSGIMFVVLLVANALAYLGIFQVNYSSSVGRITYEGKLLICNYILCGICMFLFVIGISSCVELASVSYSYKSQEEFFDEYSDYSWCQSLVLSDGSDDEKLQGLLNTYMEENPETFFYLCRGTEFGEREQHVFYEASSGTKNYLKNKFSELDLESSDHDVYILTPQKSKISDEDLAELAGWLDTDDYEIVYYSETMDIIYRDADEDPITRTVTNPTIVFHNHEVENLSSDESFYEFFMCMIHNSDSCWTDYANENGITYVETNAWDYYCYRWQTLSRTVLVNIVVVVIMAFMMLLSIYVVIKLDFKVNAQELTLKKIYGHTRIGRFKKLYIMVASFCVVCFVGLLILKHMEYNITIASVLPVLLLTAAVECLFISGQIVSYEKKNLQGILKGGSL